MRYNVKITAKKFNRVNGSGKTYENLSAVAALDLICKKMTLENNERLRIIITLAEPKARND